MFFVIVCVTRQQTQHYQDSPCICVLFCLVLIMWINKQPPVWSTNGLMMKRSSGLSYTETAVSETSSPPNHYFTHTRSHTYITTDPQLSRANLQTYAKHKNAKFVTQKLDASLIMTAYDPEINLTENRTFFLLYEGHTKTF